MSEENTWSETGFLYSFSVTNSRGPEFCKRAPPQVVGITRHRSRSTSQNWTAVGSCS
ncbi:hypothetical protein KIN_02890 [Litoreibacter roseus]|uniref:Uncharacterized protein n=1 Tax=Litoreibacter roseus TaxID=2601869 RepID=A0A6N6JAJ6_9RHOB|nr:hypothetical protein KIN_02890 [Litoreibacter roseus]